MVLRLLLRTRQRQGGKRFHNRHTRKSWERSFDVNWGGSIPLPTTCKLREFDVDEPTIGRVLRELIGSLSWIALLSRPEIVNAVRAVARYCSAPKMINCKAALGILILHFRGGQ